MASVATVRKKSADTKKKSAAKNVGASYNKPKSYNGKQYTGMQIGRTETWHYDSGVWKDTKVTPDQWNINFNVIKRRAGHAPKGSGAAVGTGYHWFILSHQYVEKLNADDYTTAMVGMKFKLAHKRASKGTWSVSDQKQRKELIQILEDFIKQLKQEPETTTPVLFDFSYRGKAFKGIGIPVIASCKNGVCSQIDITLNKEHLGVIKCTDKGWRMTGISQGLVNTIGNLVTEWYE